MLGHFRGNPSYYSASVVYKPAGGNNLTLTSCPLLFDCPGVELGPGAPADLFPGGGRSLRVRGRLILARRGPDLGSTTDGLQEQRHGDLGSRHPRSVCAMCRFCGFPPARSAANTAGSRAREFSVSRPPSRAPAAASRRAARFKVSPPAHTLLPQSCAIPLSCYHLQWHIPSM